MHVGDFKLKNDPNYRHIYIYIYISTYIFSDYIFFQIIRYQDGHTGAPSGA